MQKALALVLLVLPVYAYAQQAPWGRLDIPVSSHDRVYAADQTSNTISVIDPSSNTLLGVIRLGDPVPGALSPLYRGQLRCMVSATRPTPRHSPSSQSGRMR